MRPCSREMQGMNSLLNPSSQIPLQDLQNQQIQNSHFDPNLSSNEDFLEQMLSSCSWADPKSPWDLNPPTNLPFPTNNNSSSAKHRDLFNEAPSSNTDNNNVGFRNNFDESVILASKLRQHQISCGNGSAVSDAAKMMLPQQLLMAAARGGLSLNDDIDGSLSQGGDGSMQGLFNGFGAGSMNGTDRASNQSMQHFNHSQGGTMQSPNLGAQGAATTAVMNQPQASGSNGGAPAQPRQRVRARRGQATDPHSIAERLRRERIAERMKSLQELVPNANKTDKASMLDEIIDYVKFLQLQVKVLSMSRLGGAAAVAPLVADMSSEAGGDCIQANDNGGSLARTTNGNQTASTNDNSVTVTEHQVAKMMEEDMGTAMQYLQGKGLCLMPISLASAISTATCHNRTSGIINNHAPLHHQSNGEGPTSPSMSVLTVQSMTMGNGGGDGTVAKDAASVSKP